MSTTLDPHAEIEKAKGRAPQPPVEEQVGRLNRTRESMERHGIDVLLLYGSAGSPEMTRYLAGYVHVFPGASSLLVIPLQGTPVLLIDQPWHLEEAARMSWIEDVRQYPNPARKWLADELQSAIRQAVQTRGAPRPRIGVFAGVMPSIYADVLSTSLPGAVNVEAIPVWEELVGSPSAYDGEMIRATARVADAGFAAAVETAAAGVPEYEVCFAALRAMASLGAEFLHGSGVSTHINIGSFSDAISNVRPFLYSSEPLEQGQMFWLDLSASHAGYYTDSDRTISVGEPNEEQRRSSRQRPRSTESCVRRRGPGSEAASCGSWRTGSSRTPGTRNTRTTSISATRLESPPPFDPSLRRAKLPSSASGAS